MKGDQNLSLRRRHRLASSNDVPAQPPRRPERHRTENRPGPTVVAERINPTRSFGPALVSYIQNRGPNYFRDFWVFVIGPVTGATVAAAYYKAINAMQDKEAENEPAADRADDVKPVEA